MKTKRLLLTALASILITTGIAAQSENTSFTIATDPFSPTLGGYDFELGYNFGKNRIAASISAIEVPEFYNSQSDDFEVERSYFDIYYTRFLNDQQTGFHYGVSFGYIYDTQITEIETGLVGEKDFWRAGLRVGYFWEPFKNNDTGLKNLFVEPTFNFGFALNDEDLSIGTDQFDASIMKISGPLFHIGFKF